MNLNSNKQESYSKQTKNYRMLQLIRKLSFLLFLQGTVSFEGFNYYIELKYQPVLQQELFIEAIARLNITESNNLLTH